MPGDAVLLEHRAAFPGFIDRTAALPGSVRQKIAVVSAVQSGGAIGGERMAERLRADVPLADVPALLAPVFAEYARNATSGESFGDYCARVGTEQLTTLLPAPTVRRRRSAGLGCACRP